MKSIRATIISVFSAILIMGACGNATAQEGNKSDKVIELCESDFNTLVFDIYSEKPEYLGTMPAIVDFTATWCGPCRQTAPILDAIAKEYAGKIVVYKVDVDKCRNVAAAIGISSIPAILYIPNDDSQPVMTVGGRSKEQFKKEILKYLKK